MVIKLSDFVAQKIVKFIHEKSGFAMRGQKAICSKK